MNTIDRTHNSARNIIVSVSCQLVTLVLSFVVRTVFIQLLGADYLGVSGLFGNILTVLSLADLGIGAAITFALYRPIAENDTKKIQAYMHFFKRVYMIIAAIVFSAGCVCIPFLDVLVNVQEEIPNLTLIYLLLLGNSSVSYLCVYKSTLLIADQRVFITKIVNLLGVILADILELVVLLATHDYICYLIVQVTCTLATNITISIIADKYYPFLKKNHEKLPVEDRKYIFKSIGAMMIYRMAGVVLNATDNILISVIISTTVVGFYSNYTLITGALTGIASMILEALKGSIGSLTASDDIANSRRNFNTLSLFNFWIYGFISVCLFVLINDFIKIWAGAEYVLPSLTVFAIILNIYLPGSMNVLANYRDTTGTYMRTKYIQVFTAAINLGLSILLGNIVGLSGILLATAVARLTTSVWYEPMVLFKEYFKESSSGFFVMQLKYLSVVVIALAAAYFSTMWITAESIVWFLFKAVICAVVVNIVFILIFWRSKEFKDLREKAAFVIKKKQK